MFWRTWLTLSKRWFATLNFSKILTFFILRKIFFNLLWSNYLYGNLTSSAQLQVLSRTTFLTILMKIFLHLRSRCKSLDWAWRLCNVYIAIAYTYKYYPGTKAINDSNIKLDRYCSRCAFNSWIWSKRFIYINLKLKYSPSSKIQLGRSFSKSD